MISSLLARGHKLEMQGAAASKIINSFSSSEQYLVLNQLHSPKKMLALGTDHGSDHGPWGFRKWVVSQLEWIWILQAESYFYEQNRETFFLYS
jgi:hypothetical protein